MFAATLRPDVGVVERRLKIGPARSFLRAGLFACLADRAARAVGDACNEHEADDREPRDHEGNSIHGCCPFWS